MEEAKDVPKTVPKPRTESLIAFFKDYLGFKNDEIYLMTETEALNMDNILN